MENNNNSIEHNSAETQNKSTNNGIVAAIILAGVLIGGAILLKDSKNPNTNPVNTETETVEIREISKGEHILGDPNSDIIIVEYSDTECPFCKRFHETMHQVVQANPGKVAWVYRHFPIEQLHAKATYEAEASECAWEQGGNEGFWTYIDQIYLRTQSNDSLEVSELTKIATDMGLNIPTFTSCLESGKYTAKVQNDILDGDRAGVRGTPTSFIVQNGVVIETIPGAQSYEVLQSVIDSL